MLIWGDLLWIISATRIKRLIGGFSFGWFLIIILYQSALVSVIDERRNLKFQNVP